MDNGKQTAIEFLLLLRPAGGPYRLEMGDGQRWLMPAEYRQQVTLWTWPEDAPEEYLIWQGTITAADIAAGLTGGR
jgi:hypothetical protein